MMTKKDCLKHPDGSIFSAGYGQIAKIVMCDRELSIEAKAIYSYLCSFMGAGDTAFPSVRKMCFDLHISKDRFYKHMGSLIEQGYIKKKQYHWKEDGQFCNNDYIMVLTVS